MNKGNFPVKRFAKYILLGYLAAVLLWAAFCMLALKFPALNQLALKIDKPVVAIAAEGDIFVSPEVIMGTEFDPNGHYRVLSEYDLSQVDYWILILEQFADIETHSLAEPLGLTNSGIADMEPGNVRLVRSRGISARLHPLPIYVSGRNILVLEAKTVVEDYKPDCIGDIFFAQLAGTMTPEFLDSCSQ